MNDRSHEAKAEALREATRARMREEGVTLHKLVNITKAQGVGKSTLYDWLHWETTQFPSLETLTAVADALGTTVNNLQNPSEKSAKTREKSAGLRVIGVIGDRGRVATFDGAGNVNGAEEGGYQVQPPRGADTSEYVALEVKGDSMRPTLKKGWLVIYREGADGVPEGAIGELCVVETAEGAVLVKELQPGHTPGRYNLESANADTIRDVALKWAAKVRWIDPGPERV